MLKFGCIVGSVTGSLIGVDLAIGHGIVAAALIVPVVLSLIATLYFELIEPRLADA